MNDFIPTHEITLTDKYTHQRETIEVMLVDGSAYTEDEWDAAVPAAWMRDDAGSWWFHDEVTPDVRMTVSVRKIKQ
jgi:hypothetical protein